MVTHLPMLQLCVTFALCYSHSQAIGLHGHEEKGGHEHEGETEGEDSGFVWKLCVVIVGVYLFFMLEVLLHSFGHSQEEASSHNYFELRDEV